MLDIIWPVVQLKACERCDGALALDYHPDVGYFWVCIRCGHDYYTRKLCKNLAAVLVASQKGGPDGH